MNSGWNNYGIHAEWFYRLIEVDELTQYRDQAFAELPGIPVFGGGSQEDCVFRSERDHVRCC